jgi:hypothetical protein
MGGIMKKLAAAALVPFFAGFLYAQDQPARTETTTTTTTWNGTLVDEGCRTTRTQRKESTTNESATAKTETNTTTTTTECPVTTTTTTFGLVTPEGKYVRFDDTSNTRIVEMVKTKKGWNTTITEHKPLKVRVIGSPNGDVVVLKEIR